MSGAFRRRIAKLAEAKGLTPSTMSKKLMNDPGLYAALKYGRQLRLETAEKLEAALVRAEKELRDEADPGR